MSNNQARPFHRAPAQFRPWTKVDDNTLRRMVAEGKNSEQIAEALGRTRASIMGRKSNLGIKQKMAAARGSKMPYVAFGRNRRGQATVQEPVTIVHKSSTIGSDIDNLIHQAKRMGLNLKIEISTEETK